MNVKDIMTPTPACCVATTKLKDVVKMMIDNDCGEIPVVAAKDDKRPIGVITDRDIVVRTIGQGVNPLDKTVEFCMTVPCITVTPDMTLVECCSVMETHQIRRVPVIDESNQLVGIVAMADVAQNAGRRTAADVIKEVSQPGQPSNKAA